MTSTAPCLHTNTDGTHCWNNCKRGTGYCLEHQPAPWTGSNWKRPKGWADLTRQVYQRDKGKCYQCGKIGSEIEHKIPQHLGGSNELWNLAVICIECHKKKTSFEANEAKYAQKPKKY